MNTDLSELRNAITRFDLAEIRRLLELRSYDLNYVDSKYPVCLLICALESELWELERSSSLTMRAPITKMLLEFGADPNVPCDEGRLPLDYAVDLWGNLRDGSEEPDCVTVLRAYGARASK